MNHSKVIWFQSSTKNEEKSWNCHQLVILGFSKEFNKIITRSGLYRPEKLKLVLSTRGIFFLVIYIIKLYEKH